MSGNQSSGRRPKPTALRILEGNRSHSPINGNEPQPRPLSPEKPDWLCKLGSLEWDRITAEMCEIPGWLGQTDTAVLAGYCQSYGRWRQAEALLEEHGLTYEALVIHDEDQRGGKPEMLQTTIKPRPEVKIAKDERAAMLRFAIELGLSPTARVKIHINPGDRSDDDLDPA